jgi:ATP-dependent Clp protease ATP-binding subunit ClpC
MAAEMQAAGEGRDYERAAELKSQSLKLQTEFDEKRETWQQEMNLDELVEVEDIAQVLQSWTGIPVSSMMETEAAKLVHMEDRLREHIVGQNEAIEAISNAIRRTRSGLADPRRPIGSFIFLGSSGVGKTEMAKALAEFLFGNPDALLTIDMSEFQERHTVSRLSGAPPGYVGYEEGGQLTEAVRRRPYQVVLFDEIEKAHPDVWNSLLQILEEGRLTDGQGHVVDFRNTVLIMTSNLGTRFAQQGGSLGFIRSDGDGDEQELRRDIESQLKKTFRPEFLNRVDDVIIFHNLTADHMLRIVDLQMVELAERLQEQKVTLALTEAAREWLAQEGFDPLFGARPLRRALQRYVENPLALQLLSGELEAGALVADAQEGSIHFSPAPQAPPGLVPQAPEAGETQPHAGPAEQASPESNVPDADTEESEPADDVIVKEA